MSSRAQQQRAQDDAAGRSWRARAVTAWSLEIHGPGCDRHEWAEAVADALDAGVEAPPFPARSSSTRASRLETALRLYREAPEPEPEPQLVMELDWS